MILQLLTLGGQGVRWSGGEERFIGVNSETFKYLFPTWTFYRKQSLIGDIKREKEKEQAEVEGHIGRGVICTLFSL